MTLNKKAEELADLIEANPNCRFDIDNDVWYITQPAGDDNDEGKELAESGQYSWITEWYSHSSNYGAGLAEAMVILLNRRGFKIEALAV
jgi:hypothetical protein